MRFRPRASAARTEEEPPAAGRQGVGWAYGHHGELLQGVFHDHAGELRNGLVTLPNPARFSRAVFRADHCSAEKLSRIMIGMPGSRSPTPCWLYQSARRLRAPGWTTPTLVTPT